MFVSSIAFGLFVGGLITAAMTIIERGVSYPREAPLPLSVVLPIRFVSYSCMAGLLDLGVERDWDPVSSAGLVALPLVVGEFLERLAKRRRRDDAASARPAAR